MRRPRKLPWSLVMVMDHWIEQDAAETLRSDKDCRSACVVLGGFALIDGPNATDVSYGEEFLYI